MYIWSGTVTVTDTNIYSNTAIQVSACLLEPSRHFLPTPPNGRKFPELTSDDRFLPSLNLHGIFRRCVASFLEISSYAPAGRNFRELTKCKLVPCLAGWGYAHSRWHSPRAKLQHLREHSSLFDRRWRGDVHHWLSASDCDGHQHLLEPCEWGMRSLLELSWHFLPTSPTEETS